MSKTYYTLEHDLEQQDWQCSTTKEAKEKAQDWYADTFDDEPMRNDKPIHKRHRGSNPSTTRRISADD